MLKSYILAYDLTTVDRKEVTDILNSDENIRNWYAFMPGAIAVVTTMNSKEVSSSIMKRWSKKFQFIVVKADEFNGYGNRDIAQFIREPEDVS